MLGSASLAASPDRPLDSKQHPREPVRQMQNQVLLKMSMGPWMLAHSCRSLGVHLMAYHTLHGTGLYPASKPRPSCLQLHGKTTKPRPEP